MARTGTSSSWHTRRTVLLAACGSLAAGRASSSDDSAVREEQTAITGRAIAIPPVPGSRGKTTAAIADCSDASARQAIYARSVAGWVELVRHVGQLARSDPHKTGQVGLLGFSLGGFVAVAAASHPFFAALCVFYAGLPTFYAHPIDFLPPLIDVHGDADRSVSLRDGEKLVAKAKALGGVAELAVFPHQGHGFDLDLTNQQAAAARQRAIGFLRENLNSPG